MTIWWLCFTLYGSGWYEIITPTHAFSNHGIKPWYSFALHKIGKIRQFLTKEATKQLVHALVISRIDFCNSLLYSLPDVHTNKLQRIQNSAARLITRTKCREHITPILKQLHWLPVKSRINYKILLLTY